MATAVAAAIASTPSPYTLTPSMPELEFHRRMAERARRFESPAWRRAGFVPRARVADVGCGTGMVLAELADLVGPQGHAVGIESDAGTRAAAGDVLRGRAIRNAQVVAGEPGATGLAPASRDAIMLRHLLVQNGMQARAIVRHLASRLRPGGALYLVETDPIALRFLPFDRHLEEQRTRILELLAIRGNDLSIGSKLGDLIRDSGLDLVERDARWDVVTLDGSVGQTLVAQAHPALERAGLATARDVERWNAAWARFVAESDDKVVFMPVFHAIGRRRRTH